MKSVTHHHDLGDYQYTAGDDINGRPIYRKGTTSWFAVKTVPDGYKASWIGSIFQFGEPGSSSGLVFESDYINPKCPHSVSGWRVYLQTGNTITDPNFTVTCAVCKCDVPCKSLSLTSFLQPVRPQSQPLLREPRWIGTEISLRAR